MTEALTRLAPPASITAETVMRRDVVIVDARARLTDAWAAMQSAGVEHAVVLEAGICLGVVALSEMWVAWGLDLTPASHRSVLPLVTPAPFISADVELTGLCRALLGSRYGAAMVVDDGGRLLGLVTSDDVLSHLAHTEEESC